ncbi:MAG TPA: hypothetical protein VGC04_12080 [Cellulomonas sp.]
MTTPDTRRLAAGIEQAVRRTPAVTALYWPGPWWTALARQAAAGLGLGEEDVPAVTVAELPDGSLDVTAAIATAAGAADTCRAVHDAIAAHLRAQGYPTATIHITVVQVAR